MHVRCFYRQRRGDRTLVEAARATGINKGVLSRIERGEQFPSRTQIEALAAFYCPESLMIEVGRHGWMLAPLYPPSVLRVVWVGRPCVECGKNLPPESRRNRKRHEGGCP